MCRGIDTSINMTVLLPIQGHGLGYAAHRHRTLTPTFFLSSLASRFAVCPEVMALQLGKLATALHRLEFA